MSIKGGKREGAGRKRGIPNKATASIKGMLSKVYTEEEQIAMWNRWRLHEDARIANEWDKLAISYLYGKPSQPLEHTGSINLREIMERARLRDPD